MKPKQNRIIVGKPKSKFSPRMTFILLLAVNFIWLFPISGAIDLILRVTKFTDGSISVKPVVLPICIILIFAQTISICVRCSCSWSVDDEFFCYNDDSDLSVIQKIKAMGEILKKGYFSAHTHLYRYDEITYVKLYYRKHFSYMSEIATTQYFKVYFEDGSILDAPFKLETNGPKIYEAFQIMKNHGVYLEDPCDLLTLLKNDELLDLRGQTK